MKTDNKPQSIPMSIFTEAALTHFKCRPGDIGVRMITENKEAFVVYKGEGYKISTREILRENIADQLTDKYAVHDIDFGCWIQAIKNTVIVKRMLGGLIRTVEDTEQAEKLLIAAALGAYTDNADVAFWEILARIDPAGDVLGNAIVSTAQVYNGPGLVDDITELHIMHGGQVYNRMVDGIFETVYVDDDQRGTFEFYIYSADYSFDK
jgi:hypothetical protein